MQWIEHIECIFKEFAFFCKSSFAVIHINWNKRQPGNPLCGQYCASDDCLQDFVITKRIEKKNKAEAADAVIRFEYNSSYHQYQQYCKLFWCFISVLFNGT